MRKCGNCKHRMSYGWSGVECCMDYEFTCTEAEEIEAAKDCPKYEEGTPECLEEERYCPSATAGDYSPSCPWGAPGMSERNFI